MPAVLMENPKHGRNHFYSPQEVAEAKLNGWTEVSAPAPVVAEAPKAEPKAAPKAAPKAKQRSR